MELAHIEDSFIDIGGQFFTSGFDIRERLPQIKAIIFDWDGLFNDGFKSSTNITGHSEIDATGIDLLRFGFHLAFGKMIKTAVITGSKNMGAHEFAKKENFDNLYCESRDKAIAFQHFSDTHHIKPSEVICLFSDIADVPVARQAGISLAVGRSCNPIFMEYLIKDKIADYISSCHGHENVVREFTELLLGLLNKHFEAMDERASYGEKYVTYRNAKSVINTAIHKCDSSNILVQ